MIRRDMRKAKNDVRRSKDYNRYHDQEEIAAYENAPTEMEECIDNEDDEMQQAPPNDYNKIPSGVDASPETVDFSRKEAMKIDCNTAPPDERATIQEEIPLEKIPPTEKATVPEAIFIGVLLPNCPFGSDPVDILFNNAKKNPNWTAFRVDGLVQLGYSLFRHNNGSENPVWSCKGHGLHPTENNSSQFPRQCTAAHHRAVSTALQG